MARILIFAGALLWIAMAVVVQRQRVLHRRLRRLERAVRVRRRAVPAQPPVVEHWGVGVNGPARSPASRTLPTVQQLARLARPLQRAGG